MELLRQSRPAAAKTIIASPVSPVLKARGLKLGKINWLAIMISGLALVLVFGTGYFLLTGLQFNAGELTLELNENQTRLKIDSKDYGQIDSGMTVKLRAGGHKLILAKDGFLELEKTFTIVRKKKSLLSFQLLPIPEITRVGDANWQYARLDTNGTEITYFDARDQTFKLYKLADAATVGLFRGSFGNVTSVAWSPTASTAVVKVAGRPQLANTIDNRGVPGRYVVLGERPEQGKAKYNGTSTWLFDDNLKGATGWRPVLLNDSIRQAGFSANGAEIVYIYDTADGEYSLVRALPDGQEWERVIVDLPKLDNASFMWGPDDRYLIIENDQALLLADLVAKTITPVAADWLPGSLYQISPDGSKLAYLAGNGGEAQMKTYDFISGELKTWNAVQARQDTIFTWLDSNAIVAVTPNQSFEKISLESGDKLTIPFVGAETNLQIRRLAYSPIGQTLMLIADSGVFVMKI